MAVKQPGPLIIGSPAAAMRVRTLREQVEHYLSRMRHTVPFPCSTTDAYFGCVPVHVKQWHADGLFEMESPLPGRATNLLATMFATAEKQDRRNILHVCVESAEEYLEAQRGNRGYEGIFWIEVPEHVPIPRNSKQTPFYLPDDHPFHDVINEWVEQAFTVEDEIQESLSLIEKFSPGFTSSATEITNLWPELMNFVHVAGARQGLSKQVAYRLREAFDKSVTPGARNEVTTQLARAVMLPANRPPLQAWVRFYTQEIGA